MSKVRQDETLKYPDDRHHDAFWLAQQTKRNVRSPRRRVCGANDLAELRPADRDRRRDWRVRFKDRE
jgi:hypothetical protein